MCHPWEEVPVWAETDDEEAETDETAEVQREVSPS